MNARRCPRSWEATAVEDDRLSGAERFSFERHAATCSVCAREVGELARLRELMQRVAPPPPTALELRRTRLALLRKAHGRGTRADARTRRAWTLLGVAMIVVAFAAIGHRRPVPLARVPAPEVVAVPLAFDVVRIAGAAVTSRSEGGITRAAMGDGIAAFHVEHVGAGLRFLVGLPDGELEVRGTRFVVRVQDGHTRSVDVSEGVVVLRLRGDDERRLGAGDRWTESLLAREGSSSGSVGVAAPEGPVSSPPRRRAPSTAPSSPKPSGAPDAVAPALPSAEPRSDAHALANQRFAAAIAAFGAGSYAEADALLESFGTAFPGDARSEDASFLRAVAHSRMNDPKGALSLARAYLRDFPRGFRRREAESLARESEDERTH
ncbi:MAG: FecR family protein [Myxococcota bacterium]|nr:FecR family protein [Myxococcota bacterium]